MTEEWGKLLGDLKRSLALEVLWPGVFDAGRKVRAGWVDVPTGRTGKQNEMILYELRFDITSGDETRSFGREEVPACIPSPQGWSGRRRRGE